MKTKRKFQNYVIDFVWHLQIKVEIYELSQIVFYRGNGISAIISYLMREEFEADQTDGLWSNFSNRQD